MEKEAVGRDPTVPVCVPGDNSHRHKFVEAFPQLLKHSRCEFAFQLIVPSHRENEVILYPFSCWSQIFAMSLFDQL